MQMRIESTDQITTIDGVCCRVWHGTTEAGVPCTLFIHRIAVRTGRESEFDRELQEQAAPPELRTVPLRQVL